MGLITAIILPAVEKQLEAAAPELLAFALKELELLGHALISLVQAKIETPKVSIPNTIQGE
jgi:hypothetical protein